jgi:hypothetical protein
VHHNSFTRQDRNTRHGDGTVNTVRFNDVREVSIENTGHSYEVIVWLPDDEIVMTVNPPDALYEQLVDMEAIEP